MKYTIKIILLLAFIAIKIHSQEQKSLAKPVNLGPQLFQVSINIASNQGLIYIHQPGTDKATSLGKPLTFGYLQLAYYTHHKQFNHSN